MKGDGTLNYLPLTIEKIRPFFLEGFELHQYLEMYYINDRIDGSLKKPADSIDFTKSKCKVEGFENFINPSLSGLAALLGAEYSSTSKIFLVKTFKYSPAKLEKVEIIKIRWKNDVNAAYQVLPRMISKPKDLKDVLYSDYLSGKNCDYQLIAENNFAIGVHSLML